MAVQLSPEMLDVQAALGRPLAADMLERLKGGQSQKQIGAHYGRLMGRAAYHESTISRWRKDLGLPGRRLVLVDDDNGKAA